MTRITRTFGFSRCFLTFDYFRQCGKAYVTHVSLSERIAKIGEI